MRGAIARFLCWAFAISVVLGVAYPASAGFHGVTSRIDRLPHTTRTWIPFLSVARAYVWLARPAGVRSFRLAVFEERGKPELDLKKMVEWGLGPKWSPLVHQRSRGNAEETLIYARYAGNGLRLMVVARDDGEIVVIRTSVNPDRLIEVISDPDEFEHEFHHASSSAKRDGGIAPAENETDC